MFAQILLGKRAGARKKWGGGANAPPPLVPSVEINFLKNV